MFSYELIGETQQDIKLQEIVAFICLFSTKVGCSIPFASKI